MPPKASKTFDVHCGRYCTTLLIRALASFPLSNESSCPDTTWELSLVHVKSDMKKAHLPLLVAAIFERWMQVDDDDDETSVRDDDGDDFESFDDFDSFQVNRNTINLQPNREDTDHCGALVINED